MLGEYNPRKNYKKPIDYRIDGNGCFICESHALGKDGYRLIKRNRRMIGVHRYIYEQCFGYVPENMVVRHKCDVRNCINPEHLEVGTAQQNTEDMVKRGRQCKGEKNGCSKLTEEDVINIRFMHKRGVMYKDIQKIYDVSKTTIYEIAYKRKWKHVD